MVIIEVVYADPKKQMILSLKVPKDSTVKEAIQLSGILKHFPEIDLEKNKVGLFGNLTSLAQKLRHQDRIEIYRPLLIDPKEARRKRTKNKI
jgi:putative ubiquitin-RnfH superfamily antitoxin RatB of RatAB toxin-antitoxin module